jgi:hypothetical protein
MINLQIKNDGQSPYDPKDKMKGIKIEKTIYNEINPQNTDAST